MTRPSKQFEKDVWVFANTLDPSSEVLFNHKVLDKDTGSRRQVDVWINAKLGNHIPISILVSCKNHKRKLNISHIESFAAEVRSTTASTGIIYSSSGFSASALKKAKSEGLACCRLFRSEPADIPQSLLIWSYCCKSQVSVSLIEFDRNILKGNGVIIWKDLFAMQVDDTMNLLDHISAQYHRYEKQKIAEASEKGVFPENWTAEHTLVSDDEHAIKCKVIVYGRWKKYKGKIESHLLNGSYCFSNNEFRGRMRSPPIDTKVPPGRWWEEIKGEAETMADSRMVAIFSGGDVRTALLEHFGTSRVTQ